MSGGRVGRLALQSLRHSAMDVSSWFRRNLFRSNNANNTPKAKNPNLSEQPRTNDDQTLGVTEPLIAHVRSFTFETFKNFPLSDGRETNCSDNSTTISGNARYDLSEWQERHAMLVLSKVKELSQLRYKICPGYLKEHQFWRVYFSLVKNYVAEYELQAIRVAKIKEMALENVESADKSECEVEMAETKKSANLPPPTP